MIGAAAVFVASFLTYLGCLYPTIAPRDSADMAAAAMTLGVAHPPGYPLYSLSGHAWLTLLPWGNAAYRLNVLSAIAGSAAVSMLFVFLRRRLGNSGAAAGAAFWALSAPLWKFSLLEEKYAFHAAFAAAALALTEGERDGVFARARLSGLIAGLGLVCHQSFLFAIPGLLWLWRDEAARCRVPIGRLLSAAAPAMIAGLSMHAFLWIRMGGLPAALETIFRSRYGTGTLSAGLARPLTPESLGRLLAYAVNESARAVGWPAAAAAILGAAWSWRERRSRVVGLILIGAASGPLFIVLSRFDPAMWVARSVLEPAFLLPSLVAAALAAEAVAALGRERPLRGAALAVLLPAAGVVLREPPPEHRDDFLAYDFVRDLRRAVPPGGALLASGDTASFGWRYLDLVFPSAPREFASAKLIDGRRWVASHAGRADVFLNGLGPADLRTLGLPSTAVALWPEGLVQRIGGKPGPFAPSVLRRPRSWSRDESYARDAKLTYAFAAWLSARLLIAQGRPAPQALDLFAAATDPEDYRWR